MIACVDLFCGLGGLTHGLHRGGINVVAGIDIDPQCKFPYEHNNTARFIERDIHELTGDELRELWGVENIRLLAGCAPCQPFSTYSRKGRQKREDTERTPREAGYFRLPISHAVRRQSIREYHAR